MSLKLHTLVSSFDYVETLKSFDLEIKKNSLVLKAKENKEPHPRLGYNVPKRGTRFAYRRNRLKRLLKEYFRLNAPQLPKMDYVLVLTKELPDEVFSEALEQSFSQATKYQRAQTKTD